MILDRVGNRNTKTDDVEEYNDDREIPLLGRRGDAILCVYCCSVLVNILYLFAQYFFLLEYINILLPGKKNCKTTTSNVVGFLGGCEKFPI